MIKNIILKSPAKINLFLKVGQKIKSNKYHNIQSLFFNINLYDKILISEINKNKDEIKFIGKFKKYIKKDNSVKKSISSLRKLRLIDNRIKYKIIVEKNIPVFSGLGGGSSNAATLIKFFLKKENISKKKLNIFEKILGSDFKVLLKGNKVFKENLNKIVNIKFSHNFYIILVYPFLKCSSKEIYSNFKSYEVIKKNNNYKNISKNKLLDSLKSENNSLEDVVIFKFPIVGKILEELELTENCEFSRVTGSGSSCFALFLNKKDASVALKRIRKRFPGLWSALCKTI